MPTKPCAETCHALEQPLVSMCLGLQVQVQTSCFVLKCLETMVQPCSFRWAGTPGPAQHIQWCCRDQMVFIPSPLFLNPHNQDMQLRFTKKGQPGEGDPTNSPQIQPSTLAPSSHLLNSHLLVGCAQRKHPPAPSHPTQKRL